MTDTTQVLSERQIKDFIDDGLFLDTPNAIARAIESATLKAVSGQEPVATAWDEGYRHGMQDERTSEANIGIAGFGAKVDPARQNPYRTNAATPRAQPAPTDSTQVEIFGLESAIGHLSRLLDAQRAMLVEVEDVCGRDAYGARFEDGESSLIDKIRAHLAATTEPAQPAPVDERETRAQKHERNWRVQSRYNELMRDGERGHYEAMFRVVQEEVEAARAALQCAQAPQAGGWQPIETAPKDGRRMFVVCGFNVTNENAHVRNYTTDPYCVWPGDSGGWVRWPHTFPPTHWHPLPPAPQPTKGQP